MKLSKRYFRELAVLSREAPELVARLGTELPKIAPQLYPFDSVKTVVKEVVGTFRPAEVEGASDKRTDFADELCQSVTSLLYTAGSTSVSPVEFVRSAAETLELNFPEHVEILANFVKTVISCRNLLVSFKSTALREDNENIVVDSKILVDIRPVFDFDLSESVNAHTLLYRLKLTHRTANDVESKVYTLSQEALDELSTTVERAKQKIEQIKSLPLSKTLGVLLEEKK